MTELQQAIADGIAAISAAQNSVWSFGALKFAATESDLKPNDPRMIGAPDRLIELRAVASLLPSTGWPKRGNELTRGGEKYRVHRHDHHFAAGVFVLLVHRSSGPVFGKTTTPSDFNNDFGSDFNLGSGTSPAGPDFNGDFSPDFKT